ncbi:DUF192 domain-containing protein [Treponema parvum]|uniref:DUF192 domain-containing protein n=2 Tax=Treponema parvum TaxID=138851 RepID=A0A975IDJ2_9SPIR|nr:DUF192 domain-containing protein [Treponema parvum]
MKNLFKAVFSVFACLIFLSCSRTKLEVKTFTLTAIGAEEGKKIPVKAEIADTFAARNYGFMNRKNIPDGTGMLFVFENDQILRFWMKNTPSALSIAYIDSSGRIRNIFDMEPFSLDGISSTVSVRYALEVPRGWFTKTGIGIGSTIDLSPLYD